MEVSRETVVHLREGDTCLKELRKETLASSSQIEYVEEPLQYEEFFLRYLLPNKPCLLAPWATEGWRSRQEWVTPQSTPDLHYIRKHFGTATVPVANCDQEKFSSHPKEDRRVEDYVEYLEQRGESPNHPPCLYLKDWHFTRAFPEYKAYTTPIYFQSDWLNEFWDTRADECDDYRFVYFGPKGSWTPFHADVLRSYSWSANICGRKLWWLYPPGEEEKLKDKFGQLVYDLRSQVLDDRNLYPDYPKVNQRLEVTQQTGEVIFVPSGWHHQVFNLEDTVSINHNWLNGCNVDLSWEFVKSNLRDVQREISDCREMDHWGQQCQLILKASSGIDYAEFYKFLYTIAKVRLDFLQRTTQQGLSFLGESKETGCDWCGDQPHSERQHQMTSSHTKMTSSHKNVTSSYRPQKSDSSFSEQNKCPLADTFRTTGGSEPFLGEPVKSNHGNEVPGGDLEEDDFRRSQGKFWHYVFDLIQIGKVLEDMVSTGEFHELRIVAPVCPRALIGEIKHACFVQNCEQSCS